MFDAENRSALAEVAAVWDKTEEIIKIAERLRGEVVEPSINELRYAGRRLVDAVLVADEAATDKAAKEKLDGYIEDCRFRCYCAQHDAFDASVLFVQKVIAEYQAEFGIALLHRHFPWVSDLKAKVVEADELIVASRRNRGKRVDIYTELGTDYLPDIVRGCRKLLTNKDALVALFEEQDRADTRDGVRFSTLVKVTVVTALAAAIVGSILTVALTDWFPPHPQETKSATHGKGVTLDAGRVAKSS